MDFAYDQRTDELRTELLAFMDEHVYPAEPVFERSDPRRSRSPWARPPVMAELQAEARRRGLWNLFLPDQERGAGPDEPAVRPAGRDHRAQPAARPGGAELRRAGHRQHGAAAPSSARPEQQERWLEPLLDGADPLGVLHDRARRRLVRRHEHRHCASRRDGDEYVLNGRKWWIDRARWTRRARSSRDGRDRPGRRRAPQQQHDPARAPRTRPGVQVKRGMSVFGY